MSYKGIGLTRERGRLTRRGVRTRCEMMIVRPISPQTLPATAHRLKNVRTVELDQLKCSGIAHEERKYPGSGGLFEEACSMAPDEVEVGRTSRTVESEHQEDA